MNINEITSGMRNTAKKINENFQELVAQLELNSDGKLRNRILSLIFDDSSVSKTLPFRKGGTGSSTIFAGMVKSDGSRLVTAEAGRDFVHPGALAYRTASVKMWWGVNVSLFRVGNIVTLKIWENSSSVVINNGTTSDEQIPVGYRPIVEVGMDAYGVSSNSSVLVTPNGKFFSWGQNNTNWRYSVTYLTNDPMP